MLITRIRSNSVEGSDTSFMVGKKLNHKQFINHSPRTPNREPVAGIERDFQRITHTCL